MSNTDKESKSVFFFQAPRLAFWGKNMLFSRQEFISKVLEHLISFINYYFKKDVNTEFCK